MFHMCFTGILNTFQVYFKEDATVFQECFKGVEKKVGSVHILRNQFLPNSGPMPNQDNHRPESEIFLKVIQKNSIQTTFNKQAGAELGQAHLPTGIW